jgi:hypothetical protein
VNMDKITGLFSALGALLGFGVAFLLVASMLPEYISIDPSGLEPPVTADPLERSARQEVPPARATLEEERNTPRVATSPEPRPTDSVSSSAGIIVHGVVTGPEGEVLDRAGVSATPERGEKRYVKADEEGRYSIGPLQPGRWQFAAGARDHHTEEVDLALSGKERFLEHDFCLVPRWVVAVYLLAPDGTPISSLLYRAGTSHHRLRLIPVATRERPGETFSAKSSRSSRNGIGSLDGGRPRGDVSTKPGYFGSMTLHEDGPAWLSLVALQQVLRTQPIAPSVSEVTFVIALDELLALTCTVGATLVAAENGAPLAGEAWLVEGPLPDRAPIEVGEDGRVYFATASPLDSWLFFQSPGRARVQRQVNLSPGEHLELGDVPLSTPIELRGRVHLANGRPASVKLHWGKLDPLSGEVQWELSHFLKSGPDGSFALGGLEPGVWVIRTLREPSRSRFGSLPVRVDATAGTVTGIEVVVRRTTAITLAVSGLPDATVSGAVFTPSGLPAGRVSLRRSQPKAVLHLVPGTYELVLREGDGVEESRALIVGDEPRRVAIAFDSQNAD